MDDKQMEMSVLPVKLHRFSFKISANTKEKDTVSSMSDVVDFFHMPTMIRPWKDCKPASSSFGPKQD